MKKNELQLDMRGNAMRTVHAVNTGVTYRQSTPNLGGEDAKSTTVAQLARVLMQDGIDAPRHLFSRINGTLARPGGKRISHRVERTAREILYFLFRCHVADKSPSVSDIYLATGLARGTTIRCIALLRELGVLETSTDAHDRRRSLVQFAGAYRHLIAEFSDGHCRRLEEQLAASGFVHPRTRMS
jgi:DNA-binding MarR family transcriptional regulator